MRKTFEKIATIAHAAISFIFVLLTLLILFNVLPLEYVEQKVAVDSIVLVLLAVLAVFYAGLTAYLVYCAFNQTQLLKYVELYRDSTATVMATSKTIKNMAVENAKRLGNVKVQKVRISSDGKYGLILKLWVSVKGSEVSLTLDTLRCMCEEAYSQVLGLRFSSIEFKVEKITGHYQSDVETAKKQAETLGAERNHARDANQDPSSDKCGETAQSQATEPVEDNAQPAETTDQTEGADDTQEKGDQTENKEQ